MNVVRAGTSVSALLIQLRGNDWSADQITEYNACDTKESSMNTDLTQDQIDSYQQNGFVVLHDFLTPEELETWRQAVDAAVRRRGKQRMFNQEVDEDREESYYDYVFVQRVNLWQDSLDVRRLILDPRLGKMASDLAGVEGVRIWHDQALIKQPWANPTGWHLDNPYWSYS
ncbi:MAG: phytanoyl-CoA dioxygenase family protein, partial [Caldilineaceae bacterium]|nr:phytanoyl-CoA dioxygenase family protein [Caldilineaceae bacterium]